MITSFELVLGKIFLDPCFPLSIDVAALSQTLPVVIVMSVLSNFPSTFVMDYTSYTTYNTKALVTITSSSCFSSFSLSFCGERMLHEFLKQVMNRLFLGSCNSRLHTCHTKNSGKRKQQKGHTKFNIFAVQKV